MRILERSKKGYLKTETESLLTSAQNNAISTNYIKGKMIRRIICS